MTSDEPNASSDPMQRRLAELLLSSQELESFSGTDREELNSLLRVSESNREFAAHFLLDSEALKDLLAAQEISALASGRPQHIAPPVGNASWFRQWAKPAMATAAAIALGGILLFNWMNREPIGIIRDQAGAEFAAGTAPLNGTIENKTYSLTAGMIAVEFRNGVSMTLEAPAEFEVVDEFRVRLKQGYVRAIAPETGYGFVIETPDADIVDLGTEFGVGVDRTTGDSEVHVFDGRVDVNSLGGANALASLEFGESATILDGKVSPGGSAQTHQFISPADVSFYRWQTGAESIKEDPDLVFYYGFDPQPGDDRMLTDGAIIGAPIPGTILGARWVTGRWPNKRALLFDQDADAVLVEITETLEKFTFAAWVNIDRMDEAKASIFSSIGWTNGSAHIQVNRSSHALAAGIYQPLSKKKTKVKFPTGQWVLLTAVFDQSTHSATTWINGELSMQFTYQDFATVGPTQFLLGNYRSKIDGPSSRQFRGRMDEVVLWRRHLDATEIKQLYAQGRPTL